ncbi:hypothetical protein IQ283_15100 [Alkalihalobacillus hwajinpoensis]|uniref:hypothetical protein n=1 Tax=Guptibacillus hwajinpoensis TaxID=208199 RepID=UPI0018838380|nr:hypothetical protein [Pseudalkalibacillus hwajinpoensis]MBF0707924.1 hypothetical protein [Pseudalkalibacillus hwajinpoensis]
MKDFNSLTHKEIAIRYTVLTLFLSSTIFIVDYDLSLWSYVICMLLSIFGIAVNLLKWKRGKKVNFTSKDHVIRSCVFSFMAFLLLVLPFGYSIWLMVLIILSLVIANTIGFMRMRNRLQEGQRQG